MNKEKAFEIANEVKGVVFANRNELKYVNLEMSAEDREKIQQMHDETKGLQEAWRQTKNNFKRSSIDRKEKKLEKKLSAICPETISLGYYGSGFSDSKGIFSIKEKDGELVLLHGKRIQHNTLLGDKSFEVGVARTINPNKSEPRFLENSTYRNWRDPQHVLVKEHSNGAMLIDDGIVKLLLGQEELRAITDSYREQIRGFFSTADACYIKVATIDPRKGDTNTKLVKYNQDNNSIVWKKSAPELNDNKIEHIDSDDNVAHSHIQSNNIVVNGYIVPGTNGFGNGLKDSYCSVTSVIPSQEKKTYHLLSTGSRMPLEHRVITKVHGGWDSQLVYQHNEHSEYGSEGAILPLINKNLDWIKDEKNCIIFQYD